MAIQLPRILKNMGLFIDGSGYAGRVSEIQLPKLAIKTEEFRAGGMDLPVQMDMGMPALEAKLTLSDFDPELFKSFGLLDSIGIPVTIRGAFQAQGSPDVAAVVVNLWGGWKEIDTGTWKSAEKSTLSVLVAATYYKLTVDGEELVEIDAINMVRSIGGIDQLAAQRIAIGL